MKSLKINDYINNANEFINVPYLRYQSESPRLVKAWQADADFVISFGKRLNKDYEALNGSDQVSGKSGDMIVIEDGRCFVMTPYRFRGYFCAATERLTKY